MPRPRLTERLDEALGRGVVLVCAPAGYGKTALLAGWAQRCQQPVAWLSLDAGDNDPARFWRHAVAALDQVCPGISERVGPLLGPPPPPSFEGLVTALINELADGPGPARCRWCSMTITWSTAQSVHVSVGFLLEHLPPGLHPVLASRADPPLALARLRAGGQLAELRDAELRFTADEAADVLRATAGADLPDAAVTALAARTEGWAAGLQLAALSLRGHADVAGFVAAFTGSHRYVLDYLAEEVLERQSEQVRTFLLETSVLDRSVARCVTRSAAGRAARRCWSRSSGRDCSWPHSMRSAAGGVTTSCSPTCSASGWSRSPGGRLGCTTTRRPGSPSRGPRATRYGTRSPPGICSGPAG